MNRWCLVAYTWKPFLLFSSSLFRLFLHSHLGGFFLLIYFLAGLGHCILWWKTATFEIQFAYCLIAALNIHQLGVEVLHVSQWWRSETSSFYFDAACCAIKKVYIVTIVCCLFYPICLISCWSKIAITLSYNITLLLRYLVQCKCLSSAIESRSISVHTQRSFSLKSTSILHFFIDVGIFSLLTAKLVLLTCRFGVKIRYLFVKGVQCTPLIFLLIDLLHLHYIYQWDKVVILHIFPTSGYVSIISQMARYAISQSWFNLYGSSQSSSSHYKTNNLDRFGISSSSSFFFLSLPNSWVIIWW